MILAIHDNHLELKITKCEGPLYNIRFPWPSPPKKKAFMDLQWIPYFHLFTVTFGFPNSKKNSFRENYMREYDTSKLNSSFVYYTLHLWNIFSIYKQHPCIWGEVFLCKLICSDVVGLPTYDDIGKKYDCQVTIHILVAFS